MAGEIIGIESHKRDLRKFGITVGVALLVLGGILYWRGRTFYLAFLILSVCFLVLGLFVPTVLKPVHRAYMTFAAVLGWLMARVILTLIFYVGFTSVGLAGRLLGKRFLDTGTGESKESYWIPRERSGAEPAAYERQY